MHDNSVRFPSDWPVAWQYALALGLVAAALGVRWLLDDQFGERLQLMPVMSVLFPLVLLVRPGPFFAAAVLGFMGTWFVFFPPRMSFAAADEVAATMFWVFVATLGVTFLTMWLSRRNRDLRRRDQLALRESESRLSRRSEQFETLVNEAPLGIYLIDADFRIQQVNPVAEPVFGDIPGGAVGRDFEEVIHTLWNSDYAKEVAAIVRHTLETGESYHMPDRAEVRADRGVTEYYSWDIDRIRLPDGRYGVVCYFRDVSEQVLARQAIARSEQRYRTLFESMDEGFCIIEMIYDEAGEPTDYRFIETNPAFERQSGLRDAVGKTMRELASDHEQHWFEFYGNVARTGEPARLINEAKELGRWFDVDAFRIGDPHERRVAVLFTDITERRQAERKLQESEERLRLTLETAQFGAWELDLSTPPPHSATRSLLHDQIFGYKQMLPQWTYEIFLSHVLDEDRPHVHESFARALAEGGDWEIECRIRRADGIIRWIWAQGRVIESQGRRRMLGLVCDYTKEKLAEEAQAKELRNHRRLQEISSRLIPTEDVQLLYKELVDAAVELTQADRGTIQTIDGATRELRLLESRAIPYHMVQASARLSPDAHTSCAEAARQGERVIVDYMTDKRVAGTPEAAAHVEAGIRMAQSTPLLSRSGSLVGMISTHWNQPLEIPERSLHFLDILARQAADLIERAQAAQALQESQERFQIAKAAAQLGLHDYDVVDNTVQWDDRTRELWGVETHEDITYETWRDSLHPDDVERAESAVRRALDPAGDGSYFVEYRVINRKNGSVRWIQATGQTTFSDGKAIRLIGTIQDITDSKATEEALKVANQRKDEFLATLAHELRNPLAAIRMAVGVTTKTTMGDQPRVAQMIDIIQRQSSQLVQLIDDLLDVSRITRGKVELRKKPLDFASIVAHAVEGVRSTCDTRGLKLSVALPEEPIVVHADGMRLAQVISNLLSNACKFTERGGEVRVSAERQDSQAVVCVRDTGHGIPRDQLDRVFELFMQVEGVPGHVSDGLGIGLSLAKSLTERHGGTIEAASEGPGKGSEFTVRLPIVRSRPEKVPRALSEHGAGSDSTRQGASRRGAVARRILAVDDNRDALSAVSQLLEMNGHEVKTAEDGEKALEMARTHRPEAVLLDIGLPGMDGYEVARRIRQESWGREMLLIAMTGWGQERDKQLAFEAGFDEHLTKPADAEVLQGLLARTGAVGA